MTILIEVVVEGGVDGAELLQGLHLPESQHGPFSSSEGQVGVLDPVVGPAADLLLGGVAEVLHGGLVGPQTVRRYGFYPAVPLHQLLHEGESGGLIPGLAGKGFQHLALLVHGSPEVVHLPIDLHVDLVEMPSPVGEGAHVLDPLATDLGGEHRTEAVPPEPHRLVADVDAALGQQVFHIPER